MKQTKMDHFGLFVEPYYGRRFWYTKGQDPVTEMNQIFRHPYQKAALRLVIHLSL